MYIYNTKLIKILILEYKNIYEINKGDNMSEFTLTLRLDINKNDEANDDIFKITNFGQTK